jgi:hypothetical protein
MDPKKIYTHEIIETIEYHSNTYISSYKKYTELWDNRFPYY